jgi:hypothetical protein
MVFFLLVTFSSRSTLFCLNFSRFVTKFCGRKIQLFLRLCLANIVYCCAHFIKLKKTGLGFGQFPGTYRSLLNFRVLARVLESFASFRVAEIFSIIIGF